MYFIKIVDFKVNYNFFVLVYISPYQNQLATITELFIVGS